MKKIFLSAPITQSLRKSGSKFYMMKDQRDIIGLLIDLVVSNGFSYYSAHERERWGENLYEPERAARSDFNGLKGSSSIIAHIGNPVSHGVQMELGYAISMNIPILMLYTQPFDKLPHLTRGIAAFNRVSYKRFIKEDDLAFCVNLWMKNNFRKTVFP